LLRNSRYKTICLQAPAEKPSLPIKEKDGGLMVNEDYIYEILNRRGTSEFLLFEDRFLEFKEDFREKLTELKEELKSHSFSSACEIIDDVISECTEMGADDLKTQLQSLQDHIQIEGCSSIKELSPEFSQIISVFNDTVYMIEDILNEMKSMSRVA